MDSPGRGRKGNEKMTIKEYTTAAKRFSADSAGWGDISPYAFYTTAGDRWAETCDNAHGGLDISWAFHENAATIEAEAPQRFLDQLADLLEQGIDEQCDAQQLSALLDLMR